MLILVQPNSRVVKSPYTGAASPPLGLLYIGAVLERESIPVEIIDANLENLSVGQTAALIKKKKPRFAGFSLMTPVADWSAEVAKLLPPEIVTVAGGPHPSAVPEDTLKAGFDVAVRGEGEATFLEMALGWDFSTIRGIDFRRNGEIVSNPRRPFLDPDSLPFPSRHLIKNGGTLKPYVSEGTRYFPWAAIVTSRGCPYPCYFCSKSAHGSLFRARSPENVMEEVDSLVEDYGIRELIVYDHLFNYDLDRAERILDLLIERPYRLCLRFVNGLRADKINERLIRKMKRAGTAFIGYGIESGDEEILRGIPKEETLEQIRSAVEMTRKAGITVVGFFIFGLIGDTVKTMQKTIDFAKSLRLDGVVLNIATPYPGTRMSRIIEKKGETIHLRRWSDYLTQTGKMPFRLPGMAAGQDVERMYRKAHFSIYFNPRYVIRHLGMLFSPRIFPGARRGLKKVFFALKTKWSSREN